MNEATRTDNRGDPQVDALSEEELARYYEERKGDVSGWEKTPRKIRSRRGKGASTVFPIRLAPEELEELYAAASARGITLTEFIRSAALNEARLVRA